VVETFMSLTAPYILLYCRLLFTCVDNFGKWDCFCLCVLCRAALLFQHAYLSCSVQNISVLFASRDVVFVCKTTVPCGDFIQAAVFFCIQGK
jgi:hypothetical protein